ncbi:MAG: DnaJ C-terminal domain-containing protein [Ktedonobacteraceae bacterium]
MAYDGQQSGDIRATLALSRAEAVNGTRRTLNLPGGRQVVVPVPAGISDGQEIRLEGQGQPTNYGGRGALILTIALAPSENYGSQPFPNPGTDFPTEMILPPPPPPQVASSPNYPSIQQRDVFTNYPAQDQRPINAAPTIPSYAQTPSYPAQQPPQSPSPVAQPQQRKRSPLLIALIVVLLLLIIGGSGLIYYTSVYQPNQIHAQATATAVSQVTGTAQANATAMAGATGTAVVQANATATAFAQGTAQANATATALQNIYTTATNGTPTLNDPLSQQDSSNWEVDTKNGGGGCAFTNGTFHANMPQAGFFASCFAQASHYSNFAFQVQMNILKGDRGGIIFRADSTNFKFYLLRLGQDGTYTLFLYVDNNGSHARLLVQGNTSAMHTGQNQNNTVAVVARNANLYLYVNQQYVASVSDNTFGSGQIGLFADDQKNPTEVAFSNLKIWTLA